MDALGTASRVAGDWVGRFFVIVALLLFATAALMVAGAGIETLLRDFSADDTFYYLKVAWNLAFHGVSSFDNLNRTNGYHTLWLLLITPVHWLPISLESGYKVVKLLELALALVALFQFRWLARADRVHAVFLFPVLYLVVSSRVLFMGLEAGVQFLTFLLFAVAATRAANSDDEGRALPWAFVSLACAACFLARLENVVFCAIAIPLLLGYGRLAIPAFGVRAAVALVAPCAAVIASYFALNFVFFGTPMPVSGETKTWVAETMRGGGLTWDFFESNVRELCGIEIVARGLSTGVFGLAFILAGFALRSYRSSAERSLHILDLSFLALFAYHVAKVIVYAARSVPYYTSYKHYYVSVLVAQALLFLVVGARVRLLLQASKGFPNQVLREGVGAGIRVALVAGAVVVVAHQTYWMSQSMLRYHREGQSREVDWEILSYRFSDWLDRNVEADARIGSFDCGVLGYFGRATMINLDGLMNSLQYLEARKKGEVEAYFIDRRIGYVANLMPTDLEEAEPYFRRRLRQDVPFRGTFEMVYRDPATIEINDGTPYSYRIYRYTPPPQEFSGREVSGAPGRERAGAG
jgi:hypothetical protein